MQVDIWHTVGDALDGARRDLGHMVFSYLQAKVSSSSDAQVLVQLNSVVFSLLVAAIGIPKSVLLAPAERAKSPRDIYDFNISQRRTESIIWALWLMGIFCGLSLCYQLFSRETNDTELVLATLLTTTGIIAGSLAFIVRFAIKANEVGPRPRPTSIVTR